MDRLLTLEPRDLELLIGTDPAELLGRIMRLNRTPRYHNTLNAVEVLQRLLELQRERSTISVRK